jgi:quercetin dioxygenase-like cupin family protein
VHPGVEIGLREGIAADMLRFLAVDELDAAFCLLAGEISDDFAVERLSEGSPPSPWKAATRSSCARSPPEGSPRRSSLARSPSWRDRRSRYEASIPRPSAGGARVAARLHDLAARGREGPSNCLDVLCWGSERSLTMASVPNLRTDVLLRSEQAGGHVSVTEIVVPARTAGPPLHTHDFDEAFYMLEGELIFRVEDELSTKRAGELVFAPRNVAHALANHSDADARYLLVCTPAGFERHWGRVAAASQGVEPPDWALQPIPEVIVVGPQIASDPAP